MIINTLTYISLFLSVGDGYYVYKQEVFQGEVMI